jgi:hypothetical protein
LIINLNKNQLDILLICPNNLLDIVDICPIGYPIGCPKVQLDKLPTLDQTMENLTELKKFIKEQFDELNKCLNGREEFSETTFQIVN